MGATRSASGCTETDQAVLGEIDIVPSTADVQGIGACFRCLKSTAGHDGPMWAVGSNRGCAPSAADDRQRCSARGERWQMPLGRIQAGKRAELWQRPACQNEVLTHQAEAGKVIAGPAALCGGPLPGLTPLAARWSRILSMTFGWVMTARTRMFEPHRGQTRGSVSYTILMRRAQARLLAWRWAGESPSISSFSTCVTSSGSRPCLRLPRETLLSQP